MYDSECVSIQKQSITNKLKDMLWVKHFHEWSLDLGKQNCFLIVFKRWVRYVEHIFGIIDKMCDVENINFVFSPLKCSHGKKSMENHLLENVPSIRFLINWLNIILNTYYIIVT